MITAITAILFRENTCTVAWVLHLKTVEEIFYFLHAPGAVSYTHLDVYKRQLTDITEKKVFDLLSTRGGGGDYVPIRQVVMNAVSYTHLEEKEQVREQIKNYHRFEMLIRQGRYYRLTDVWQKKE